MHLFIRLSFDIVVANGLYTFHSMHSPYAQEDFFLNDCWRSRGGKLFLDKWCHVFIARVPALSADASKSRDTVAFESVCLPGYFLRQKNYHFLLQKRDGTKLFGKISDLLFLFGWVIPYS